MKRPKNKRRKQKQKDNIPPIAAKQIPLLPQMKTEIRYIKNLKNSKRSKKKYRTPSPLLARIEALETSEEIDIIQWIPPEERKQKEKPKRQKRFHLRRRLSYGIIWLAFFFSVLLFMSARWYLQKWGDMGFDTVLFTLQTGGLTMAESSIVAEFFQCVFLPAVAISVLAELLLFVRFKTRLQLVFANGRTFRLFPFPVRLSGLFSVALSLVLFIQGGLLFGVKDWIAFMNRETEIYKNEYVEPTAANVVFEGEKRNLVYIYLESMETTLFSQAEGGALSENVIPELYRLAEENVNFSHNEGVGGACNISCCGYTIAAMVGSTCGLPFKITYVPLDKNQNVILSSEEVKTSDVYIPIEDIVYEFYPGAKTLSDILHDNGYYQTLMVGSDSHFGGRNEYYAQHHTEHIYDLATAAQDSIIEEGYKVWWGFEDEKLFQYAKQELIKIAAKNKPFAFTMLTADTHFPDGYACRLCKNQYNEQYENVYACSSRQIYDFVQWMKTQDFYDNTTIILAGDHLTMDKQYIADAVPENYTRHIYNCFLNAAKTPVHEKNRVFTDIDMFPTTLSAMGATVVGGRLGLGVDLFSAKQTLAEKYGVDVFEEELSNPSQDLVNLIQSK